MYAFVHSLPLLIHRKCMHIHACNIYIHMDICICIYIYTYLFNLFTNSDIYIYVCMYVYTYIHIRTRCTWLKPRTVWEHPEILSRKSIVSVNPNKS